MTNTVSTSVQKAIAQSPLRLLIDMVRDCSFRLHTLLFPVPYASWTFRPVPSYHTIANAHGSPLIVATASLITEFHYIMIPSLGGPPVGLGAAVAYLCRLSLPSARVEEVQYMQELILLRKIKSCPGDMSTTGLQVSSGVRVKANDVGIAWILAYI